MATDGFAGIYIGTHNYGATAAFWRSLGFSSTFETDHGSGQWEHPAGGPYIFIAEEPTEPPGMHLILGVRDAKGFAPERAVDYLRPFTPEHWGMLEAVIRDPDGRPVSLQAPLPDGSPGVDADAHHADKYG